MSGMPQVGLTNLNEAKVKDIFTLRCYQVRYGAERKSLYPLLKPFLRELVVEFSDKIPTAELTKSGGRRKLLINRAFVERECKSESDLADLCMHELFHRLLGHLSLIAVDSEDKYIYNLATDSIVNAHLHRLESAEFCRRYYPDEVPYSFLRPGSVEFRSPQEKWSQKFSRVIDGFLTPVQRYSPAELLSEYRGFYFCLYHDDAIKVSTDEAIQFFRKHFGNEVGKEKFEFLGSHGGGSSGKGSSGKGSSDGKSRGDGKSAAATSQGKPQETGGSRKSNQESEGHAGKRSGNNLARENGDDGNRSGDENNGGSNNGGLGRSEGSVFDPDEIRFILEELGLVRADRKTLNNFAAIIKRITAAASKPGKIREGTIYRTNPPARLTRKDFFSIERGRFVFERGDYKAKQVLIFFDYSGSMSQYARFMIDLARSLERSGNLIRVAVWADGIKEVPYKEFLKGKVPQVGYGTQGEVVARFLRDERMRQCVIVTDNNAGEIRTKIEARVFLVLVPHGTEHGSFADRRVVPDLQIFRLSLGD